MAPMSALRGFPDAIEDVQSDGSMLFEASVRVASSRGFLLDPKNWVCIIVLAARLRKELARIRDVSTRIDRFVCSLHR